MNNMRHQLIIFVLPFWLTQTPLMAHYRWMICCILNIDFVFFFFKFWVLASPAEWINNNITYIYRKRQFSKMSKVLGVLTKRTPRSVSVRMGNLASDNRCVVEWLKKALIEMFIMPPNVNVVEKANLLRQNDHIKMLLEVQDTGDGSMR